MHGTPSQVGSDKGREEQPFEYNSANSFVLRWPRRPWSIRSSAVLCPDNNNNFNKTRTIELFTNTWSFTSYNHKSNNNNDELLWSTDDAGIRRDKGIAQTNGTTAKSSVGLNVMR